MKGLPMSDLASLLEQVRSAKGADRELDWHVADATGHESFNTTIQGMWQPYMTGSRADKAVPAYTASIDAALALVDRKLPGWSWKVVGEPAATNPHCAVIRNAGKLSDVAPASVASHRTAPLAILLALLTALITQGDSQW